MSGPDSRDRDVFAPASVTHALTLVAHELTPLLDDGATIHATALLPTVERLLDEDEPDMYGWMYMCSDTNYFGTGYAYTPAHDYQLVATCGTASIRVSTQGLTLTTDQDDELRLPALEATPTGPGIVNEDGQLQPLQPGQATMLLSALMGGNDRVTEVKTSFSFLCYRPLIRLRALLLEHETVTPRTLELESPA